jgi:hypothetical protein
MNTLRRSLAPSIDVNGKLFVVDGSNPLVRTVSPHPRPISGLAWSPLPLPRVSSIPDDRLPAHALLEVFEPSRTSDLEPKGTGIFLVRHFLERFDKAIRVPLEPG